MNSYVWRKFCLWATYDGFWCPSVGRSSELLCSIRSSRFDILQYATSRFFVKVMVHEKIASEIFPDYDIWCYLG